jgi:acid phosphatase family membrane protein YuiD
MNLYTYRQMRKRIEDLERENKDLKKYRYQEKRVHSLFRFFFGMVTGAIGLLVAYCINRML